MKYVNSYLSKNCSSELQALVHLSRNPLKEISESMGAYKNMLPYINTKDENHTYLFIGDGSLCLTGAIFAFLTKGKSISIDPLVNVFKLENWVKNYSVKNFIYIMSKFEDVVFDKTKTYTIICVHAHVNLENVNKKIPNWDYLYSNPCCNREQQTFTLKYQRENSISCVVSGIDENILSDKNEVVIYKKN